MIDGLFPSMLILPPCRPPVLCSCQWMIQLRLLNVDMAVFLARCSIASAVVLISSVGERYHATAEQLLRARPGEQTRQAAASVAVQQHGIRCF